MKIAYSVMLSSLNLNADGCDEVDLTHYSTHLKPKHILLFSSCQKSSQSALSATAADPWDLKAGAVRLTPSIIAGGRRVISLDALADFFVLSKRN